jgi:uncharacterized protein YdcH (DUF465 family)
MAQISRLKADEISNGNLINADDLDAEFDQLVNESNSQDTRISAVESSTFTNQKTFNAGLKTDTIDEKTAAAGVTVDGVLLKDGMATLAGLPAVDGQVGVDNNLFKVKLNGSVKTVATTDAVGFPKGYLNGPAPTYTSEATVTFPAGLRGRDSANAADIELAGSVVVTLASVWTVGTPGLDAGSEANSTWYYYYLIRRPDTGITSVIASTVNESASGSITLPTNYTQKRQLPFAVRNEGSGNILPFCVSYGWPYRPYIWYNVRQSSNVDGTLGPCNALNNGTASSWTTINLSGTVPPISTLVKLKTEITSSGGATAAIRKTGESHEGNAIAIATGGQHGDNTDDWETNSSQQIDYKTSSSPSNFDINLIGYTVTGVS